MGEKSQKKGNTMITLKMNTILNLVDYYFEICDEDVEAGNRLICTLEDILPFYAYGDMTAWEEATNYGTGEDFIEATYDVLWDAACRDYNAIKRAIFRFNPKASVSENQRKRWEFTATKHWNDFAEAITASVRINAPFIGFEANEDLMGMDIDGFKEDTIARLNAKMRLIANRLGQEADFNE